MTTVTIAQGSLEGGQATTESGFSYYEFFGIPYAKPPIGELRFKSPQSPEPWQGTRDATTVDSTSISCQINMLSRDATGTEDCLYLNVYTPKLRESNAKPKPVMVLIHGGGFIAGNGIIKEETGPDYLIENDVVIVTINYRLGPLGFLCLDIPEAAGNMGLKDMVKALQWVQSNIDKFGGDKNNVTIFGVSAGSAACEFLMLTPLSKGLFHKCILQSGSTLNNWAINYPDTPKILAIKLAQTLGYKGPDDDIKAIHKVLLETPSLELTGLAFKIAMELVSNRTFFGFVPVIEQDFGSGDVFLSEHPYTVLREGIYNQVPVIRGFCNAEGIVTKIMKPTAIKELMAKKTFVDFFAYKFDVCDIEKYNSKFLNIYIGNGTYNSDLEDIAMNFFGDLTFSAGIQIAGMLQCDTVPVYMYEFCYDGNLNTFKALIGMKAAGAAHGDEIGYLLRHVCVANQKPNETDLLVRNRITKMWTNFAKTSNPTPDDYSDVQWPAFSNSSKLYLQMDKEFTVKADYEPEKIAIFEAIYDKYKS